MAEMEALICGPGGWADPRAVVMSDGSVMTTQDGITWTPTTQTREEIEAAIRAEGKEQAP